ncbi:MAG TPA: ABC transporter permease subunit, partial [Actinomycetota bacterium]
MKPPSTRRKIVDRAMLTVMGAAVLVAVVPLVAILVEVAIRGLSAVHGLSFFTQATPGDPTSAAAGIANAIIGTLLMVGLASLIFIPLGILGAVYLVEYGPGTALARVVRFFTEVMTGIPSIIFGVFIFTVFVLRTHRFSGYAGALAIGLIMWPIVVRTSEEILIRVPTTVREASMALGIPKWKTVLKVVLPSAAAGLTTG